MLDSGSTQHMTGDSKMFSSLYEKVIGYSDIIFCDNSRGKIEGIGKIAISNDPPQHGLGLTGKSSTPRENFLVSSSVISLAYFNS